MSELLENRICHEKHSKCRLAKKLFQVLLAITILSVHTAYATLSPEITLNDNADNIDGPPNDLNNAYEEKRSWQSLQGSWGKRAVEAPWADDSGEVGDDEIYFTEHWTPLMISNGERSEPMMQHTMLYLTSAATLERLLNQRQSDESTGSKLNGDFLKNLDENSGENAGVLNEKRTWKNMNAAWGKRRNAPAWNKFRGAWGKREPGWNNLKGMWGKRSSKDWQKLHGGWGKRAQTYSAMN